MPRWLKAVIIVFLIVANIAVVGLIWAINTGNTLLSGANTDEEVVGALTPVSGDSLVFLVLGSDSRSDLDDLENFGAAGGQRGDVIMLVRVDRGQPARILSIPRDLWVNIPGHGEAKINAAYAYGGPSLMVRTIQENLGIPINHYVEIGFTGFQNLVNEIGGVEVTFPYPARDTKSGLDVGAGTQTLNGDQALAYARSRQYQELQNGTWVSVEANDIGRTKRQQTVVGAILRELKSPSSVGEAGTIASTLAEHMIIDAALAESSVPGLFWDFRGVLTSGIDGATLPVDLATIGSQSVVLRREPDATQAIDDFLTGIPSVAANNVARAS